ncbi:DUF3035 domain-containing protein [Paracoccus siganidrum]|uniref:DUF3035 domain-containing protein n=1 Tax=Paracoccus siganidrum TaxID=1276757 RepID=A0A418ZSH9_9RHOB|nr:DUF3035 domain-containing protein [Paracoccus siganidrum]RJK99203.1 DUF3035 domain-containing protein [Paracoccus siganidrum]RMC37126.1 DUF3035 domain-containing protein [Paracoccus siganidrum]
MRAFALMIGLAATTALSACGDDRGLMNLRSTSDGPDEFAILPTRPLSMPPDLAVLPAPTPGGANITDPTPIADAVGVLGGNPAQLADQGIAASDQALVAHAARRGSDPAIRTELAQTDAERRARNGRRPLERLFGTNVYMRTYAPMRMDAQAEQERWQRAGAQTPSAPPPAE